MRHGLSRGLMATAGLCLLTAAPASAAAFFFSTGNPDGRIGTLSVQAGGSQLETETADDFILANPVNITGATFVGLLPSGAPLSSVSNVEVEIYHVFPVDSVNPPDGRVPTRVNSPADIEIASATRDGASGGLSFSATLLSPSFTVANSVVHGINPLPNQHTGGEGAVTGEEVQLSLAFTPGIDLAPGHYFFRPEVLDTDNSFLWLSAAKPIVGGTGPFTGDLQAWIRNDGPGALAPDWSRIGTDIVGGTTFNETFTLSGTVPEPGTLSLVGLALVGLGWARRRRAA
ncbi:MAG: PEP-CTERM sorting domain-containing protein [Acetobacteraceae bacterium]